VKIAAEGILAAGQGQNHGSTGCWLWVLSITRDGNDCGRADYTVSVCADLEVDYDAIAAALACQGVMNAVNPLPVGILELLP
jgi:hypothetical protein